MNPKHLRWVGAVLLMIACLSAPAEPSNPLTDRLSVSLGGFLLTTDTDVRVDGSAQNGSEFNVERELGFRDTDRFRIDAWWRFKPRHKMRLMYFDTRRSASRRIEQDIAFRGAIYPLDTEVQANFDTAIAELAYEYAFLQRDRYEVSATIGIHNLRLDLALSTSAGPALARSATADGPLPVVGLRGVWRLTDRLYIDAQAQYFRISLDPYDGRIADYNAAIVWQAFDRAGLGIGYNAFVTRLDVDDEAFDGRLQWRYDGARIFLIASF